jgi:hypothetical protein
MVQLYIQQNMTVLTHSPTSLICPIPKVKLVLLSITFNRFVSQASLIWKSAIWDVLKYEASWKCWGFNKARDNISKKKFWNIAHFRFSHSLCSALESMQVFQNPHNSKIWKTSAPKHFRQGMLILYVGLYSFVLDPIMPWRSSQSAACLL